MKKLTYLAVCILMLVFSTVAIAEDVFIEIKASKPEFIPASVTVKKGDQVTLKITSTDVPHGIHLEEFGFKDTIIPEKESVTFNFTPEKAGTFFFPCTKYCSLRHLVGMRPRLEIKVVE